MNIFLGTIKCNIIPEGISLRVIVCLYTNTHTNSRPLSTHRAVTVETE